MHFKALTIAAFLISAGFAAQDTSDYAQGVSALDRGDIKNAKVKLTAAYKDNSSDPFIQMAYASVVSCSLAVTLYKTVGENKTAPDSLRSVAYKKLGDYYYASKEYLRSIENYRYASKYSSNPIYKHHWALAASASGDTASAKSLWHTLTLEFGDTTSEIANYHLGLLLLKNQKYQDAFNSFSKTGVPSQSKPWAVASIQGKIDCAAKLGKKENTADLEKQLDPWRDMLLEAGFSGKAGAAPLQKTENTAAQPNVPSADSTKQFTLQIGAFSQKENAAALEQKLKSSFQNVKTVQFDIEDKKFYRVWIGTFISKEAALQFGNDSLVNKGFSFRVVEK